MRIDANALNALVLAERPDVALRSAWAHVAAAVPELAALDMDQGGRRLHKDNAAHTLAVVAKTPARVEVRLAALFHDVGKPATRVIHGDGTVTFHSHEHVGARITERALGRLGYDAGTIGHIVTIVRLSGATKDSTVWSDSAVRRFVAEAGAALDDLLDFVEVDVTSRHRHKHDQVRDQVAHVRSRIAEVTLLDARRAERPVVSGDDVMARYGLGPGRAVGQALAAVLAAQRATTAAGGNYTVEQAWALLDQTHTRVPST